MRIIFHHPAPLNPAATSASGIRPLKMLKAFEKIGYQVDRITGYASERKECINYIKKNISNGIKYEFMYSESTTWPTYMPSKRSLTLNLGFDFGFFKYLVIHDVPIGLFYRDIYWLFPELTGKIPFLKTCIAKYLFWYDLRQYQKCLKILYLPSVEMAKYIPLVDQRICRALPPGHDFNKNIIVKSPTDNRCINILYVGGLGQHYQMHKLFDVLTHCRNISFTLCTRMTEWESARQDYPNPLPPNINIVHKSGSELGDLYKQADIASIFVRPEAYWEFAAPFKLYEYLGMGKPVIASKGTLAGKFIEENNIGWCIPYEERALDELLKNLIQNHHLIVEKASVCDRVRDYHSWATRAEQVVKELSAEDRRERGLFNG